MWIPRAATSLLQELASGYPIVAITGPRQAGKTTLAREVFPEKPYLSLEDLDEREFALRDPRGFLSRFPDGAVLDEVQRAPDLFSYLQTRVDDQRRMGLFVLTGSQQFGLSSGITQSLAGRVASISLLPFTLAELQQSGQAPADLETLLVRGLYPPIYDRRLRPEIWYANYVLTYLERDVRQLLNIQDLNVFQRFLRMCAARTGQLVNLSGLAADCGIAQNTAKAWLSVLEASYLVVQLQPFHRNYNKRLVKTPKLYFLDPGLAAWLVGVQEPAELVTHAMRGPLFETWVVSEVLKARFNQGLTSNAYFWRDRSGHEVDLLLERGSTVVPIEVKSGQTVAPDFFTGLRRFRELAGAEADRPWVVYGGEQGQSRGEAEVLPWREIARLGRPGVIAPV
jgi:predicted AAA+ superfamily ATPase